VVYFIYGDLLPCTSSSDHSLPQSPPDRSADCSRTGKASSRLLSASCLEEAAALHSQKTPDLTLMDCRCAWRETFYDRRLI